MWQDREEMTDVAAYVRKLRAPLAAALIAATALEPDLTLLTGNTKHFAALETLKIERFEP